MTKVFDELKQGLEEAIEITKCEYCNPGSSKCEYYIDELDNQFYQDVETLEWDEYDDGYVHMRIYGVKYCQYCGRKLVNG